MIFNIYIFLKDEKSPFSKSYENFKHLGSKKDEPELRDEPESKIDTVKVLLIQFKLKLITKRFFRIKRMKNLLFQNLMKILNI